MSRQDQDIEELIRFLYATLDYAKLGMRVSTYHNCNSCGTVRGCKFAPKYGEAVRRNCPLWAERKQETI